MKKIVWLFVFIFFTIPYSFAKAQGTEDLDNIVKEQYKRIHNKELQGPIPGSVDWRKYPPKELALIFTETMRASLSLQKDYLVKMGFYHMPVIKQCDSFAYFTARSLFTNEIAVKDNNYILLDMYIVMASPKESAQTLSSPMGFTVPSASNLTNDRGSIFFMHENGKRLLPWNHHTVAVFAIKSLKDANIYYIVMDPFLFNRAVGLKEWTAKYHPGVTDFNAASFQINPKKDKKRFLKAKIKKGYERRFIAEISALPKFELTIKR